MLALMIVAALLHVAFAENEGAAKAGGRPVIFTGAMFSTLLTLFVVPVIYGALARFTKSPEWTARKIEQWEAREATANDPVPHAAE